MELKNDHYTYRVTWSDDDNEYVGLCAEFASLSWLAATPEAALKGIRKVVADVVRDMKKMEKRCQSLLPLRNIAANLWCACHRRFIEILRFRQQNQASA